MKKLHPFPVMIFGSVVVLFISLLGFRLGGPIGFLLSAFVLYIPVGLLTGLSWTVYPWQVALIGSIPCFLFLIWRLVTSSTPSDSALDESLFVFLPIISIVSGYFGAYMGRWITIRRRRSVPSGQNENPV
jgi:hypothetical protein